jgi:hypothetical protein
MFTPFHKPPYTYPYGRSVDETTTVGVNMDFQIPLLIIDSDHVHAFSNL